MRLIAGIFLLFACVPVMANCVNSITPSCDVYDSCFNKYCNCTGSDEEYLMSFGKQYCDAFLNEHSFTSNGNQWRDNTLRCLQEAIVPSIPFTDTKSCNCQEVKKIAYTSHVSCYTQPNSSVCDLPSADIKLIATTIIFNSKFISAMKDYSLGIEQVRDTFTKCSSTAKEEGNRKQWTFYSKLLHGKLK